MAPNIARSKAIQRLNDNGHRDALEDLLVRGQKEGTFRSDVDPIDLHMSISALCIFNIANRETFSTIFKRDMASRKALNVRACPGGRSDRALRAALRPTFSSPALT